MKQRSQTREHLRRWWPLYLAALVAIVPTAFTLAVGRHAAQIDPQAQEAVEQWLRNLCRERYGPSAWQEWLGLEKARQTRAMCRDDGVRRVFDTVRVTRRPARCIAEWLRAEPLLREYDDVLTSFTLLEKNRSAWTLGEPRDPFDPDRYDPYRHVPSQSPQTKLVHSDNARAALHLAATIDAVMRRDWETALDGLDRAALTGAATRMNGWSWRDRSMRYPIYRLYRALAATDAPAGVKRRALVALLRHMASELEAPCLAMDPYNTTLQAFNMYGGPFRQRRLLQVLFAIAACQGTQELPMIHEYNRAELMKKMQVYQTVGLGNMAYLWKAANLVEIPACAAVIRKAAGLPEVRRASPLPDAMFKKYDPFTLLLFEPPQGPPSAVSLGWYFASGEIAAAALAASIYRDQHGQWPEEAAPLQQILDQAIKEAGVDFSVPVGVYRRRVDRTIAHRILMRLVPAYGTGWGLGNLFVETDHGWWADFVWRAPPRSPYQAHYLSPAATGNAILDDLDALKQVAEVREVEWLWTVHGNQQTAMARRIPTDGSLFQSSDEIHIQCFVKFRSPILAITTRGPDGNDDHGQLTPRLGRDGDYAVFPESFLPTAGREP